MVETRYSAIVGTGSYIPPNRVSNQDFLNHKFLDLEGLPLGTGDNRATIHKFEEITEISERRYVDDDMVASDIGREAAEMALQSSGIDPESLDYIIVAHNFGDIQADNRRTDIVPSLAARVKQMLGIANPHCIAYDLPFGCPGWLQAVIQADYFLRSGDAERALVIGTDTLSRVSDPHDRDSMIYADGAGAVILQARTGEKPAGILSHATRSDTLEHARLLWMGPSNDPEGQNGDLYLKMNGRKLYEYALSTVPQVVKDSLDKARLSFGDVKKILIHQANGKMDSAILKRLGKLYGESEIPAGIMPMTISQLGNSSVATVPTLLDLIVRGKLEPHIIRQDDTIVFASVGAGMNINSLVYRWV